MLYNLLTKKDILIYYVLYLSNFGENFNLIFNLYINFELKKQCIECINYFNLNI